MKTKNSEIIYPKKKKCSNCGKEYPVTSEYFHKNKDAKDNLSNKCKSCCNLKAKKYRQKNKKKIKEKRKEYYQKNKEKIKNFRIEGIKKLKNRKNSEIIYPKKKKCSRCGSIKLAKGFFKNRTIRDGLSYYCKKCKKKSSQESIKKLKNRKNSEIIYPKKKKCSRCGSIKLAKEFFRNKSNKDGLIKWCKKCCKKYQQKEGKEYRREYRKRHRKEINKYEKNKRKNDINFRMAQNLRTGVRVAFKNQNVRKLNHTIELIGCTVEFLRKYLESQFLYGMSFKNYGNGDKKWCIDHIKPCVAFDLIDLEQQRKCFNYKNLQPLWNKDNLSKSSFYEGKFIRVNKRK